VTGPFPLGLDGQPKNTHTSVLWVFFVTIALLLDINQAIMTKFFSIKSRKKLWE
jgi:hypothetical protein